MSDYDLCYWPIPIRGQLIRWVMTHAGATWSEQPFPDTLTLYRTGFDAQPIPFMGPPFLHDRKADVWMSQLPAVLSYLGGVHGLMPAGAAARAATVKLICDANDVLDTITRGGGARLWTQADWDSQGHPRLLRWMGLFEQVAQGDGLDAANPGLADVVSAALWHTMTTRMHVLRPVLEATAPTLTAHTDLIAALPRLAQFDAQELERLDDVYCGREIETSLQQVLKMPDRTSQRPL